MHILDRQKAVLFCIILQTYFMINIDILNNFYL